MTSATLKPSGAGGRHAEGRGYGLIIFASVLLLVIGFFNLLDGIAAIANSHVFIGNAHYVVGDLRAWGWTMTIFGALQLLVAAGLWTGNQPARWFAVAVVGLNAIGQMFFIPAYPFLVPDDHRGGHCRAAGAVRLRQPREPWCRRAPQAADRP
jgi:hypothetical protein